jgi:hypothetical protein
MTATYQCEVKINRNEREPMEIPPGRGAEQEARTRVTRSGEIQINQSLRVAILRVLRFLLLFVSAPLPRPRRYFRW